MTFVSYAQNFEDVMLHRALRDIARGFYVDVGAQAPVTDSVTKAFSLLGWRGINVEPVSTWHQALCEDRPHDVNLRVLASADAGTATFYEVVDTGLSTLDAALAQAHERDGRTVHRHALESRSLDSILGEHAPADIHFLKIDVEGAEAEVLKGLSLDRYRPWILVIESRAPNSTVQTHAAWEPDVLSARYRFAYDDGLNRFYVAEEHADRLAHFQTPPNVWDDFVRAEEHHAVAMRAELARYENAERLGELSNAFQRAMFDIQHLQRQQGDLNESLANLSRELAEARGQDEDARRELAEAQHREDALEARLRSMVQEVDAVRMHADVLQTELLVREMAAQFWQQSHDGVQARYDEILRSRSWKLTRPIRVLRRLVDNGPGELLARFGLKRPAAGIPAPAVVPEPPPPAAAAEEVAPPRRSPREAAARAALDGAWRDKQGQGLR